MCLHGIRNKLTWDKKSFILILVLQVALVALATNPSYHKDLFSTVKSWPSVIYSTLPVISAIEPQLNTPSMTDSLKEVSLINYICILNLLTIFLHYHVLVLCQALAELYVISGQYDKAFSLYADVGGLINFSCAQATITLIKYHSNALIVGSIVYFVLTVNSLPFSFPFFFLG